MPLSEFVRYLNTQLPWPKSALHATTPFVSEQGRVSVLYGNLRLESAFSPIVDTLTGNLRGHAARLVATGTTTNHPYQTDAVFQLPDDHTELIFLDRLVRTLHALNYLTYRERHPRGLLLLKVHPRHVASVATDHGLAFEEILRGCGLLPTQIALEFVIDGVEDTAHLTRAIASYASRGYSIGLNRLGQDKIDFPLLQAIRPALVKFDRQVLSSPDPVRPIIDQLHDLGAQIVIKGLNSVTVRADARENGFDLLQARAPARRLLHAPGLDQLAA